MKVGVLLLKMRKERRLSQDEVAERLGVCQSTYCAWESDRVTPSAKHYGPLAALFGIAISVLLEVGPTPGSLPAVMPLVPANNLALLLQEELVKAQRETIALQKQRIEHLEAEGQQLRVRLTELEKLGSVTLVIITSLMNFISIPLEYISELIVA